MERAKGTPSDDPKEFPDVGKVSDEELKKFDAEQQAKREAQGGNTGVAPEVPPAEVDAPIVEAPTGINAEAPFTDDFTLFMEEAIKTEITAVQAALGSGRGHANAAAQAHLIAIIAEGVKLANG